MSQPEISIVMPTYNQSKYLEDSINSIITQTFTDFELIIVDDGSTDDTMKILNKINDEKIKVCRISNSGTGAALNVGFSLCKGKYETWWASDNILYPSALKDMHDKLIESEADLVYTNFEIGIMSEDGKKEIKRKNIKEEVGPQEFDPHRLYERFYVGVVWLWKKELRIKAGEKFITDPCEDYVMILRMLETGGKFQFLDKNLAWVRRHSENLSHKLRNDGNKYVENLVKKEIAHRDRLIKDNKFNFKKSPIITENVKSEPIQIVKNPSTIPTPITTPRIVAEQPAADVLKEIFTAVYNKNTWGSEESKSGKGSDITQTSTIIKKLPIFLNKLNIRNIIDCACGDLNWMKEVLTGYNYLSYIGIDIVEDLIKSNKEKFKNENRMQFFNLNFANDPIPYKNYDMIFCRDALVHLSFATIKKSIRNFINSGAKYLMTTTFIREDRINYDMIEQIRGWRLLNFRKSPFNFPEPAYMLIENCTQRVREHTFEDKVLAVWVLKDLERCI